MVDPCEKYTTINIGKQGPIVHRTVSKLRIEIAVLPSALMDQMLIPQWPTSIAEDSTSVAEPQMPIPQWPTFMAEDSTSMTEHSTSIAEHSTVNLGKPDVDTSSEQDMSETSTLLDTQDAVRVVLTHCDQRPTSIRTSMGLCHPRYAAHPPTI